MLNKQSSKNHNNIAAQYDCYYEGGEQSIYNQRFDKQRIFEREASLVRHSFKTVFNKFKTTLSNSGDNHKCFRILDFGCGDGRIFELIVKLTKQYVAEKIPIQFIAYDPSKIGLENFKNTLQKQGFNTDPQFFLQEIDCEENQGNRGYIAGQMTKNNITVIFIHGDVHNNYEYIIKLIGSSIHFIMCIFAVLSHIAGRKNRQQALNFFKMMLESNGELLVSVAGKNLYTKQQICFQELREQYDRIGDNDRKLSAAISLAKEPGDIYYCRSFNDKIVDNYFHIFKNQEFLEDITTVGLYTKGINILSITYTPNLLKRGKIYQKLDQFIAWLLSNAPIPYKIMDKFSDQIYARVFLPKF